MKKIMKKNHESYIFGEFILKSLNNELYSYIKAILFK